MRRRSRVCDAERSARQPGVELEDSRILVVGQEPPLRRAQYLREPLVVRPLERVEVQAASLLEVGRVDVQERVAVRALAADELDAVLLTNDDARRILRQITDP